MREVIIISILYGFDQKNCFFERCTLFKFNNLGLAVGMNLKIYISVAKGLKLKFRKFWRLVPTFVEVTEEKMVWELYCLRPILNRLKWSVTSWKYSRSNIGQTSSLCYNAGFQTPSMKMCSAKEVQINISRRFLPVSTFSCQCQNIKKGTLSQTLKSNFNPSQHIT